MLGLVHWLVRTGDLRPSYPTFNRSSPLPRIFPLAKTLASSTDPPLPAVAVFWDLDNKPPNSVPPYDAAVRLRLAASSFGPVRYTVAYANHHAFRHVPGPIRAQRAERRSLDHLEKSGCIAPSVPYVCRVCGRNFYNRTKLVNHFRQIHETEQAKRLNRLESARGSRKVHLAAKFSMKMEKYKRAVSEVLVPKVGYGLGDELKRAGVWVRIVQDRPEAADRALRDHIVNAMDRGGIGCLVLVSDDSGFMGVMREARMRCLRTVVVGDEGDGALKRCADAAFSWKDVASGKARKEASSAVVRWKDRDLLKRLEWRYGQESEEGGLDDFEGERDHGDGFGLVGKQISGPWWKIETQPGE